MKKLKGREMTSLFILLVLSRVMLDAVAGFVSNSGTAAYINSLLCTIIVLIAVFTINKLASGKNIGCILTDAYGKKVSAVLYFILFVLTVLCASQRLNLVSSPISKYILRDTPPAFICMLFVPFCFYVVVCGIGAVSAYAYVVALALALILGVIIISSGYEAKIINLCPIFGKGNFINVFNMLYVFSDILYFYLFTGRIKEKTAKSTYAIVLISGIVTTVLTVFFTMCIPYPASVNSRYPIYTLASLANSSVLIQRMDGLVFILWIVNGMLTVSCLTLFATVIFKEIFCISNIRGICPLVVFTVFAISLMEFNLRWVDAVMWICAFLFLPFSAAVCRMKKIGNTRRGG